jgi:cytochrome P450
MGTELMAANFGGVTPQQIFRVLRFFWRARAIPLKGGRRPEALISLDGARHDRLRAMVNRGFTPRRIEAWAPRIDQLVEQGLAKIAAGGSFDVVRDLAVPLPSQIIAEMLGIDDDRVADFKRWSNSIISVASGSSKENPAASSGLDDMGELFAEMRKIVRDRKRSPRDDLVSAIVAPAEGVILTDLEIINFVVLLMVAGNETTTNLIGNATDALLANPEQLAKVSADPSLIPDMLEEVLRYDPPVQLLYRNATEDVELSGIAIPKGSIVVPLLASANRDEARFKNADQFDVLRDARGHVGFGFGVHFCLGASLARLEAKAALEGLVPHLAGLRRASAHNEWVDSSLVRGRLSLELVAA